MEASCESNAFLDPNFALRLFSKFGHIKEVVPQIKLIVEEFRKNNEINQVKAFKNNFKSKELREEADRNLANHDPSMLFGVLELYNKSICYAEGACLAVAYAARANVYFKMKNYENCLENISLAKENGYPDNLMEELNKQKSDCVELLQHHFNGQKKGQCKSDIQLTVDPHPKIPFAASCLKLQTDNVQGRYIVTTEEIDPGAILIIETPFEKVLNNDCIYQRCSNCFETHSYNLIPCPNCTKAMFCSEICMKNAFDRFHQYECPIIDCLYDIGGQITVRIFLKAIQSFSSIQELVDFIQTNEKLNLTAFSFDNSEELSPQQHYHQIHCLSTNQDTRSQLDLFTHAMVAGLFYYQLINYTCLKDLVNEENEDSLIELMFRIELIATINSFNFNDLSSLEDNKIIGTGIYQVSSLINHSCSPNACVKYHNTKLILYTTQAIKKGDSISISYNGSHAFLPKQRRQSFLYGKYHFICHCVACVKNFPLLSNMVLANIPEIHSNGINIEMDRTVAESAFQKCCTYLREYYHYYPCKELYSVQMCLSKILSYLLINDDDFRVELTVGKLGNVNLKDVILT